MELEPRHRAIEPRHRPMEPHHTRWSHATARWSHATARWSHAMPRWSPAAAEPRDAKVEPRQRAMEPRHRPMEPHDAPMEPRHSPMARYPTRCVGQLFACCCLLAARLLVHVLRGDATTFAWIGFGSGSGSGVRALGRRHWPEAFEFWARLQYLAKPFFGEILDSRHRPMEPRRDPSKQGPRMAPEALDAIFRHRISRRFRKWRRERLKLNCRQV